MVQTILITQGPDTISSTCGSADGFSKCGPRSLKFKDKLTGQEILSWPYTGFSFDATTSKLTLDPAQAVATIELTVTVSLVDYPIVQMSSDIAVTV
jgi:hypothetical protein